MEAGASMTDQIEPDDVKRAEAVWSETHCPDSETHLQELAALQVVLLQDIRFALYEVLTELRIQRGIG